MAAQGEACVVPEHTGSKGLPGHDLRQASGHLLLARAVGCFTESDVFEVAAAGCIGRAGLRDRGVAAACIVPRRGRT